MTAHGATLTIPAALAGRTPPCEGCADHAAHLKLRRLADQVCVCGAVYGFGSTLIFGAHSGRWYHAPCFQKINDPKDLK